MMITMIIICTIPVWIIALNFRKEGKKPVLPYFLVIQVLLKIKDSIRNYNYKTKDHTRIKLRATNLQKKQMRKKGGRRNSRTIFSYDVSLAVEGEVVLFLLRAQRWSGSRSQRLVSVVAALGSAESCCNHFRPGHNPAGGPIKLPQLDIDH
jgi:hypothetical protein